ncbi:MAG: hypothetical protein QOI73_868 [Solirubrobacteraceae bacterium]|nr:hypothetical protein [Solirubrobacteraceae bacterium]
MSDRQADADGAERARTRRRADRLSEEEREDREFARVKRHAIAQAPPESLMRVLSKFDALEGELLRDRAAAARGARPANTNDLDGGRGAGSGAPAAPPQPTWSNPTGE